MANLVDTTEKEIMFELVDNIRELLGALYIQSMRNYDMLTIIADKLGADANRLVELHSEGEVLAPDPSFKIDSEDFNQNPLSAETGDN